MVTGIEALIALRDGKSIRRQGWLKDTVIKLIENELWCQRNKHKWPCREHACSIIHLLHDDWEVVE